MNPAAGLPLIRTERLLLRAFANADADNLVRIAGQRSIADTTISVPHPFTCADALQWIERSQAETLASDHMGFAVADHHGELIGYAGLHDINREHGQAELAFWIDPMRQGQGFAFEAAKGVVNFAFDSLEIHRICAYHMTRNEASGKLLKKLGFEQEGYLRHRVRKWGQFEDVKLWALLR